MGNLFSLMKPSLYPILVFCYRANATSRDVIMGSSSVYSYIAKEGLTSLKLTHVEDRCDMMNEDICRVSFKF